MNVIKINPVNTSIDWKPTNTKPIKVGLVQINNSFSGQNYLPYTSACLRSYVEVNAFNPGRYIFLPFIYKRMAISHIVENLKEADIVGFSTSVWNANISLEVARRLKKLKPNIIIIFGGPQVPDKPEIFLRKYTFIDVVAHNEGEKIFLEILEHIPECDWKNIRGVSYIDKNLRFIKTAPVERMKDLEQLPSPFLNGIFDQLIKDNPEEKWIGLWETNRGCPFQCTFCDWGSATAGKVNKFEKDRLFHELDWFAKNKVEYIFVCDANFGSLKRDIEIAQYVADLRAKTGYPHGFSVQSTKNATERAYITQKILADAGLNKGVALSMQSLDEVTLKNIKRDNISLETYLELARRFTKDKVETYSDLIIGLPGETYKSYLDGINTLIISGQHNRIQFNNLSILPNAEMGDPDYLLKYNMKTITSDIINIHGSKLQNEDDIPETQDIVIETYSMNKEDWLRTRTISWMISFVYFNKILQIPISLMNNVCNIDYKIIFENLSSANKQSYPILNEICNFFRNEAISIQQGGVEYKHSDKWLDIYWPADEYIYIKLTEEEKFPAFYNEVRKLFNDILILNNKNNFITLIDESISLNNALLNQPKYNKDLEISLSYNIYDVWQEIIKGNAINLNHGIYTYKINRTTKIYSDFQLWCKEIVWWGNKKGAYLYNLNLTTHESITTELAGHY